MEHTSPVERALRAAALVLIVLFFLFPIFWIFLMSFQTNEQILRIPPSLFFTPTLANYAALISGKLTTVSGTLDIAFMKNLWNSVLLSTSAVAIALALGIPAAYAFARFKFRLGEDIAFTLLSVRFAPPPVRDAPERANEIHNVVTQRLGARRVLNPARPASLRDRSAVAVEESLKQRDTDGGGIPEVRPGNELGVRVSARKAELP